MSRSNTTTTKTISVQHKGPFSDDPFFKDSWDEWNHAMKDAVERWDKHTGTMNSTRAIRSEPANTTNVYRQIRSSNVTSDESQAVSCTEEEDRYKMVMDVKDFNPEDINVKAVDDTVVVEGKIEKKEGNAITTQKFTRRFLLPPGVNMNVVSSALSRDGVLTITAPKLAMNSSQTTEKMVPILRSDNTITGRVMGPMPGSSVTKTVYRPPAGRPSCPDTELYVNPYKNIQNHRESPSRYEYRPPAGKPSVEEEDTSDRFNPTGGQNTYVFEVPKNQLFHNTVESSSDRRGSANMNSQAPGKPTVYDDGHFNPTGGSNTTVFEVPKNKLYHNTVEANSDRRGSTTTWNPTAVGKPTAHDSGHFNPTGGSSTTVYEVPKNQLYHNTVAVDNDRRGGGSTTNWNTFNNMVK